MFLSFGRAKKSSAERRYQELVEEGDGFEDDRDAYTMDNIFFVPEEARWSTIFAAAHTPEIGKVIDNAMRAIEAENKTLKGVLPNNYANVKTLVSILKPFSNCRVYDPVWGPPDF